MLAAAVVVACALLTGFAIQRGNTCTVVAERELLHKRDPRRLLAILHAMAWVAGLAACSGLLFDQPLPAAAFAASGAVVAGGVLLGLGAIVNGACAIAAIARIGNGEWAWLATLPGLLVGALAWRLVPAALAPRAIAAQPPIYDHAWVAALGFVAYLLWLAPRTLRAGFGVRDAVRAPWQPVAATTAIAIAFVLASAVDGPWAFTAMLERIADGRFADGGALLLPFAALVGGAMLGGGLARGARPRRGGARQARNCFVGGAIMGLGGRLAGGGFDAQTLLGQPLLLAHAWTAMGASYAVIAAVTMLDALRGRRG
ncbi:MAG: YeeE/YedE thiosulfate transporter family protein [Planctomycetota bacterium]